MSTTWTKLVKKHAAYNNHYFRETESNAVLKLDPTAGKGCWQIIPISDHVERKDFDDLIEALNYLDDENICWTTKDIKGL